MKTLTLLAMTALVTVACTASPAPVGSATTTTPSTSATSTTPTPGPTTTFSGGCPAGGPLLEEGAIASASQPATDAERIGLISWEADSACEAFTIELVTAEGAPATTPPSVTAEFLREVGVLRVHLDVDGTSVTDQLVQSGLVDRLYVVRSTAGTLFVDLILSAPAVARVSTSSGPGAVTVELQPGGSDYPSQPAAGGLVVVLAPSGGEVLTPIQVRGYGRTFEANVLVRVIQEGSIVTETFTSSADYLETWGEFSIEVETLARGAADLFVGELSAQDGAPRGTSVQIVLP